MVVGIIGGGASGMAAALAAAEYPDVQVVAGSYAHFVPGAIAVGRAAEGIDCRIHKADEFLPLADFEKLTELLILAILRFCEKE